MLYRRFSVGEPKALCTRWLNYTTPILPQDKPRYLMGSGTCLMCLKLFQRDRDVWLRDATRNARNGTLFTSTGRIVLNERNLRRTQTRSIQMRMLYMQKSFKGISEAFIIWTGILSNEVNTMHNLHFYLEFSEGCGMQSAIKDWWISEKNRYRFSGIIFMRNKNEHPDHRRHWLYRYTIEHGTQKLKARCCRYNKTPVWFEREADMESARPYILWCHLKNLMPLLTLPASLLHRDDGQKKEKSGFSQAGISATRALVGSIKNAKKKPKVLISASAIGYYGLMRTNI